MKHTHLVKSKKMLNNSTLMYCTVYIYKKNICSIYRPPFNTVQYLQSLFLVPLGLTDLSLFDTLSLDLMPSIYMQPSLIPLHN